MRILFVSPYPPWPLHGGTPIRMYHILKGFVERGHQVDLLTGAAPDAPATAGPLEDLVGAIHRFPTSNTSRARLATASLVSPRPYPAQRFATRAYRATLRRVLEGSRYDLVWVNFLFMLDPVLRSHHDGRVVMDQHEVEELVWSDYLDSPRLDARAFARVNLQKVRRYQARALAWADAVVSVSEEEATLARQRSPEGVQVVCAPNGVDTQAGRPIETPDEPPIIMLCASMDVNRNIDAARWFAEEVFPKVRKAVPQARFQVVGASPDESVRRLDRLPGVEVTGTVPEVRPYYDAATAVVAPYRYGAGTKLKTLEALAKGRPLVATKNGVRGLRLTAGTHHLEAEDPATFARHVIRIIQDPLLARAVAQAGTAHVHERFAWNRIVDQLEQDLALHRALEVSA